MTPLVIDREELGMALTWHSYESTYYLDTRSGDVLYVSSYGDEEFTEEELDEGLAEGRLLAIDPVPSSVSYGWMEEFVESVRSRRLSELLDVALRGKGSFRRFRDVLADFPAERERWFAFEAERRNEAALEWLEDNGIQATLTDRRRTSEP